MSKIELLNMDCMDYLRTLPDKSFKLAVCDPPYGNPLNNSELPPPLRNWKRLVGGGWFQKYNGSGSGDGSQDTKGKSRNIGEVCKIRGGGQTMTTVPKCNEWDVAPPDEYFEELFRVSENQIIWGGNYFPLPPTRCFLIWRKLSISDNFSMAMVEYAWTSFNDNAKIFEHTPQGDKKDPRFHPTAKPISLYSWLMNLFAKKGDNILDTHLGSGSSAIAAYELGLDFTGIEIDKYYFNKAKARIDKRTRQGKLF